MTERTYLRNLTEAVMRAIAALDSEMQRPSSRERGARIAQIASGLEMTNDAVMHFGMGMSFRQIENRKKAAREKGGGK